MDSLGQLMRTLPMRLHAEVAMALCVEIEMSLELPNFAVITSHEERSKLLGVSLLTNVVRAVQSDGAREDSGRIYRWLWDCFATRQKDLQVFVMGSLPSLLCLYYSQLMYRALDPFLEALFVQMFNAEARDRLNDPLRFSLPRMTHSSIYHVPDAELVHPSVATTPSGLSLGSPQAVDSRGTSTLTESALAAHKGRSDVEEIDYENILPFIVRVTSSNRSSVMVVLLQVFFRSIGLVPSQAVESFLDCVECLLRAGHKPSTFERVALASGAKELSQEHKGDQAFAADAVDDPLPDEKSEPSVDTREERSRDDGDDGDDSQEEGFHQGSDEGDGGEADVNPSPVVVDKLVQLRAYLSPGDDSVVVAPEAHKMVPLENVVVEKLVQGIGYCLHSADPHICKRSFELLDLLQWSGEDRLDPNILLAVSALRDLHPVKFDL